MTKKLIFIEDGNCSLSSTVSEFNNNKKQNKKLY